MDKFLFREKEIELLNVVMMKFWETKLIWYASQIKKESILQDEWSLSPGWNDLQDNSETPEATQTWLHACWMTSVQESIALSPSNDTVSSCI